MSDAITVPSGGFAYLPGAGLPFSNGVVALSGYALTRVRMRQAVPIAEGLQFVASFLAEHSRPASALAAVEVRSPAAMTWAQFSAFNDIYGALLRKHGFAPEGAWPAGRSNMAPLFDPPATNTLFAFTYTTPSDAPRRDYLISGMPEVTTDPPGIVAPGDTSPAGMQLKAAHVMQHLQLRVAALQAGWADITGSQIYTMHPLDSVLDILGTYGIASLGLSLIPGRPPVIGSDFEIDVRSVSTELAV